MKSKDDYCHSNKRNYLFQAWNHRVDLNTLRYILSRTDNSFIFNLAGKQTAATIRKPELAAS